MVNSPPSSKNTPERVQHSPVKHVLQYVNGHDDSRVPPTVQRVDGEVGGQKVGGLFCICCRTGSTTTTDIQRQRTDELTDKKQNIKDELAS